MSGKSNGVDTNSGTCPVYFLFILFIFFKRVRKKKKKKGRKRSRLRIGSQSSAGYVTWWSWWSLKKAPHVFFKKKFRIRKKKKHWLMWDPLTFSLKYLSVFLQFPMSGAPYHSLEPHPPDPTPFSIIQIYPSFFFYLMSYLAIQGFF